MAKWYGHDSSILLATGGNGVKEFTDMPCRVRVGGPSEEAVPEALLLQEAVPSRPLVAPSQALAAPMGGGAGMPANMSLVPVQAC